MQDCDFIISTFADKNTHVFMIYLRLTKTSSFK